MACIFISHSNLDNKPADRIKIWLQQQGFETPFLDFDKHSGIPPGADWEKILYREIERSEAMIIIQTPNWLDSKWCFAEFTQARALGKAIFPVIEAPTGDTLISPDIQALDLLKDREGGLEQLARELTRIALDAQGGFEWDASRSPYPGLLAFQEEDAAVYFGRDDDIRRLIERLNARRIQGGEKLVVLLGASGSGKSSLLRAGVSPRLKRYAHDWIVVPPMRPQARPVDELARALAVVSGRAADWRTLREQLNRGNLASTLSDIANDIRMKAAANEAPILLPIDQAEELFSTAEPAQARHFFEIVNTALEKNQNYLVIMALRSDFLGSLQTAEGLTARLDEFSLGPMPLVRISQIIEGPARVSGIGLEEAFVYQAARDAETEDALPLLAFALRELYDRASGDNYLSLTEYNALGDEKEGLTPLENAVRKAADEVLADARPSDEELAALRDAFVPAMVRVNEQGDYIRRPALWDQLPARSHALLEHLAKARLLVVRQDGDARMVEVAHEALLRKWPRLREWLDDARDFLTGKQQLERDVQDWLRARNGDKLDALLTGLKLNRARGWLLERPQQLSSRERDYIQASISNAEYEERRKLRLRRTVTRGAVAAALVLACATLFAGFQWNNANRAADDLMQAAKVRATELIRYAWMDLGTRQEEIDRLTAVATKLKISEPRAENAIVDLVKLRGNWEKYFPHGTLGADMPVTDRKEWSREQRSQWSQIQNDLWNLREDLIPHVICDSRSCSKKKKQPDGFDCRTLTERGLRYLYCSIRSTVDFRKVRSIAGIRIYRSGPHDQELNLNSRTEFGHYNPEFLGWLEEFIIPQGMNDARLNRLTRLVYETHLGPIVRALYHSHEILFADPEEFRAIEQRYQAAKKAHRQSKPRFMRRFGGDPIAFEKIKADYLRDNREGKHASHASFRWLSDYLATEFNDGPLLVRNAGSFWVRRSIDGTEAQIFRLLKKVLKTFEPSVLNDSMAGSTGEYQASQ